MSVIYLGNDSQECDVFNVKPRKIYLHIESLQKETQEKSFTVTNKSSQQQKVTIDNPLTGFFKIPKFSCKELNVLPEKSLEVRVKCRGKLEARPYYDTIKVICSKGCGTYVRLSASPTIRDKMKIPFDVNFGTVPLGERMYYNFKIPVMKRSTPFLFLSSIYNPDLTITPMKGTVCKEPKTVVLSYLPRGYVTLSHPIHLYLPTVSVLPLLINVTADTKPGKVSEMILNVDETKKSKFKMKLPFVRISQNDEQMTKPSKKNDWSQHKTNLFLLKKDAIKKPEFDLLGPLGRPLNEEEEIKKMKQLNFFKDLISYRKSCLEPLGHNRTVLKYLVVDDQNDWGLHWKVYDQILLETETCEDDSKGPLFWRQRLRKSPVLEEDYSYTVELPNLWFIRRQILNKFIEAVRRIVIYNRLVDRLQSLKNVKDRILVEAQDS
ncbi:unnamed protein product [Nezara viridula]|uniref:Uncharacterized protein n=1 Tax=Nezara viridula TaxID=85310 RepID=A0A9P0HFS7_NEZVI|nr:unnamed protein product [Nezara viridula]